jgi:hypothetical protein
LVVLMNLRRTVLDFLGSHADNRFGRGYHYLFDGLQKQCHERLNPLKVMEVLWELLSQGLVFVDYSQSAPENWVWVLSEKGRRLVTSTGYEPDDPEGYLRALSAKIAQIDDLVLLYAGEALGAYGSRCYLASSVMLGVASERAFQLLGESFASWLPNSEAQRFKETFDSPRTNYVTKFGEFRKRIEPHKGALPPEFADNMSLTLDSVLDLLRINRNEAGHPTGRRVGEQDAYINLQMFVRYLEKLYALRSFFLNQPRHRVP